MDDAAAPLRSAGESERHSQVLAKIARNAVPALLNNFLGFINETTNVLFIGHLGSPAALAAVGIGNMLQNVCGLSIGIGIISGLDTLASQAHGAGHDDLACIFTQRARVITAMQLLWIIPLMMFSDRWLVALGQDPEVAQMAQQYNSVSAPFMFFFFYASSARRLLAAFLRPGPAVAVALTCALLHVVWCAIFVAWLDLGNFGLGLANGATWTLRALLFSAYLWHVAPQLGIERRQAMGLQREAFRGWGSYLRVALPAMVQTCAEWWFWEICTLFVGLLGKEVLAAHVTTQNVLTLAFMATIGISGAAASLTGNALGAGRPALARRTAWCSGAFGLVAWLVVASITILCRSSIAAAFTKHNSVQRLISTLLVISMVAGFGDSFQNVMGGVFRGLGKTKTASIIYLVCWYLVMLPTALLLAFTLGYGIEGVYWAMVMGTGIAAVMFACLLARTDWDASAAEAVERIRKDKEKVKATPSAGGLEIPAQGVGA